jgi:hypothetical protein
VVRAAKAAFRIPAPPRGQGPPAPSWRTQREDHSAGVTALGSPRPSPSSSDGPMSLAMARPYREGHPSSGSHARRVAGPPVTAREATAGSHSRKPQQGVTAGGHRRVPCRPPARTVGPVGSGKRRLATSVQRPVAGGGVRPFPPRWCQPSTATQYFRTTPITTPRISTSSTMIGLMDEFAGWSRNCFPSR